MANVAVTIAMEPTYLPYERPPDPQTLWSAIPRGFRGLVAESEILAAKPVNDTETLALTGTLPANFAYIFADISLRLTQNRAFDWHNEYTLNLQNYYQGSVSLSSNWNFTFSNNAGGVAGDTRGAGFQSGYSYPKSIMWAPRGTAGILVNITCRNLGANAATAGNISAYINFWEFDLEQARKYPINAPFPTHSR